MTTRRSRGCAGDGLRRPVCRQAGEGADDASRRRRWHAERTSPDDDASGDPSLRATSGAANRTIDRDRAALGERRRSLAGLGERTARRIRADQLAIYLASCATSDLPAAPASARPRIALGRIGRSRSPELAARSRRYRSPMLDGIHVGHLVTSGTSRDLSARRAHSDQLHAPCRIAAGLRTQARSSNAARE